MRKTVNKSAIRKHCRGLTKHAANKAAKSVQGKARYLYGLDMLLKRLEYVIDMDIPSEVLDLKLAEVFEEFDHIISSVEGQRELLTGLYAFGRPYIHRPQHWPTHNGRPVTDIQLPNGD